METIMHCNKTFFSPATAHENGLDEYDHALHHLLYPCNST
jgi:hypothetical protein